MIEFKHFYNIEKPTIQYLEELEIFEINTTTHSEVWNKYDGHKTEKARVPSDTNIKE